MFFLKSPMEVVVQIYRYNKCAMAVTKPDDFPMLYEQLKDDEYKDKLTESFEQFGRDRQNDLKAAVGNLIRDFPVGFGSTNVVNHLA